MDMYTVAMSTAEGEVWHYAGGNRPPVHDADERAHRPNVVRIFVGVQEATKAATAMLLDPRWAAVTIRKW